MIALYMLFKDGIIPADLQKLLAHSQLPPQDAAALENLDMLGARVSRQLKETRQPIPPMFPFKPPPASAGEDEYQLARFIPALKSLLEEHCAGTLSDTNFPSTKPELTSAQDTMAQATSLRSAKPTWAKSRNNASAANHQRVIVFMAGGATFAEARACYEVSRERNRDVVLITSHMLTPGLFLRQVAELSGNVRQLRIPLDGPKPKAPAWVFEKDIPKPMSSSQAPAQPMAGALPSGPRAGSGRLAPPTGTMSSMSLNGPSRENGMNSAMSSSTSLPSREKEREKDKKDKKRHHFFGHKDKR